MIEIEVKPEWIGKTLIELNLRKKYSINVIAIRQSDVLDINVDPTIKLTKDMQLVVITKTSMMRKFK